METIIYYIMNFTDTEAVISMLLFISAVSIAINISYIKAFREVEKEKEKAVEIKNINAKRIDKALSQLIK